MRELDGTVKQELLAPFQSAEVRVKTQPYVAAYVTARVVMTRLDEVLPWQWDFELGAIEKGENGILSIRGTIQVHTPNGTVLRFTDYGSAPPDQAKGQAKQIKHATSDAIKRCAVHLGIGRYLYELTGVQAGKIGKPGLEKALAAVGYHGAWDDRCWGAVGGVREADQEDDDAGDFQVHSAGDGATAAPQAPQARSRQPAATGSTPAANVKSVTDEKWRDELKTLSHALWGDDVTPGRIKAFAQDVGVPYTAAGMPALVDAMKRRLEAGASMMEAAE